MKSYNSVL